MVTLLTISPSLALPLSKSPSPPSSLRHIFYQVRMPPPSTLAPLCISITLPKILYLFRPPFLQNVIHSTLGVRHVWQYSLDDHLCMATNLAGHAMHGTHASCLSISLSLSHIIILPWEASPPLSLPNATNEFSLGQILLPQASHPP